MLSPKRYEDESYENYVIRRKSINQALKSHKQGVLVWDSKAQGTYRNPLRKPICCLK